MLRRFRFILLAGAAVCLLATVEGRAGGLPAVPERAPETEISPEPEEAPPPPEIEEEFDFPEEFTDPAIEDFTVPEEAAEVPERETARIWVLFAFLGAAAIVLLLIRFFKGGL